MRARCVDYRSKWRHGRRGRVLMAKSDPHRQRIIVDTAEWQERLERLAEMQRAADHAPSATARPPEPFEAVGDPGHQGVVSLTCNYYRCEWRVWVDTVEKVPKCLLAISSKETKLSYARQLIWHPGRSRCPCELFH